jgi:hypothetical protein
MSNSTKLALFILFFLSMGTVSIKTFADDTGTSGAAVETILSSNYLVST